ncbi:AraC family transcriptional regulator [Delftia acidovorans]|uniref:helix-turn-helix transcriptional regulator n=1 Tax=Delftia acidovorans TaxID=80866 RepID=UPI00301911AD
MTTTPAAHAAGAIANSVTSDPYKPFSPSQRAAAFATPAPGPAQRDSLGCSLDRLELDQELSGTDVHFLRKRKSTAAPSQVATPASARGYLIGISLQPGHRRRIFHEGRARMHDFGTGSVYVRDFAEDYRADLDTAFDFVLMELPRHAFEHATAQRPGARIRGLACVTGMADPLLLHLAQALSTALHRPQEASPLFLDQMGTVMTTHLLDRYGGALAGAREAGRTLSRLHEARAKEMLRSRLDGTVSIGDIADACHLSRSYFIRAFRETTGQTPLQWLQAQRMSVARGLLLESQLTLAEIAAACGFADQSHFTRVFTQAEGRPPGHWRRQIGTPPSRPAA